jgi:hypothetical protein
MHPVFQEIIDMATAKFKEALSQESLEAQPGEWDPDALEEEVRQFTRHLGQQLLQTWAEVKTQQAQAQAPFCSCGQRRHLHKLKPFWWLSTFGPVETEAPQLRCPKGHGRDHPFQRLTGLKCRSKSLALQRVLTDFGAEKSFQKASEQLKEHYGVELHPSGVRRVVKGQAQRAEGFVTEEHQEALKSYERQKRRGEGKPWLIVESDGSLVRTEELDPQGGLSPKRHLPKRRRLTQWREVRLSTVEVPEEEERQYGAVLGPPQRVGEQMFALALLAGHGENTFVHGVGDGAPWIAQQIAEVFPRHRYLLDRYHLLEHLHKGSDSLAAGEGRKEWVERQVGFIDQGRVEEVIGECRSRGEGEEKHPLNQLAHYLEERQEQLDYASAREQGLPVGSGAVEGGHRHVIQARLKLPGAWWKEEIVNPMLALRTLRANGQWEAFWDQPHPHF